jgi:hypothetical protein
VPVPPIPEAGYTFMPPECAVSSLVAILLFTAEIVLLLSLLPTLLAIGLAGDDGQLPLPSWMLLSEDHFSTILEAFTTWQMLLLAIHFGVVIMWHSAAADVPPLLGAQVVNFSAGAAWYWIVPGANLLLPLQAIRETWHLSRNPKGLNHSSRGTDPLLMVWWGAFIATVLGCTAKLLLEKEFSVSKEFTRIEYLRGPKAMLAALQSATWIIHLVLFICIIIVIYRRQSNQLKGVNLPSRQRRRRV